MRAAISDRVRRRLGGATITSVGVPEGTTTKLIGTHNGTFHCDEALACGLLLHLPTYSGATVLRSRHPSLLAKADVLVDVGAVYDPATHRYDHHQTSFQDTMPNYKTRLSSAGLVYLHFGRSIIEAYCAEARVVASPADIATIYDRVYKNFIEHLDGIDNGVDQFEGTPKQNYSVTTNLSSRVGGLNPRWNQPSDDAALNAAFVEAMILAAAEFFESVDYYCNAWLPARSYVRSAVEGAAALHPSGRIMKLDAGGAPWKDHLIDIEKEMGIEGRTYFVLFADTTKQWRIMAVPAAPGSFSNRKSIPWKGLRDEELSKASGVPGGVFVHASGFIGGNVSYEGVLKMATLALEID